jgi:photosystem II stability/assembly factor-like uncharacterized protein
MRESLADHPPLSSRTPEEGSRPTNVVEAVDTLARKYALHQALAMALRRFESCAPGARRDPIACGLLALTLAAAVASFSPDAATAELWKPIGPSDVGMITSISAGRSAVYASSTNGVFASTDRGATWREAGLQGDSIHAVAAEPLSDVLYAIVRSRNYRPFLPEPSWLTFLPPSSTLAVSRDGGQSWEFTSVLNATAIAVDPARPGTAWVAGWSSPVLRTRDSGRTWTALPQSPGGPVSHLVFDPRDGAIYVATGDLHVGANGVWSTVPLGFVVTAVGAGSGPDGAVYAMGGERFCRRTNATPQWTCGFLPGAIQRTIIELPATGSDTSRILVAGFGGIWSSQDGGASWSQPAGGPVGYTAAIALDGSEPIVYAGNDAGVHRSSDRGRTWTKASVGLSSSWVRAFALDPGDPAKFWAGTEARDFESGAGLFRSIDAGGSWANVSGVGVPASVSALAIDPSDPLELHAGSFGSVFRSQDGGASWSRTNVASGLVFAIALDPRSPSTVVAAGDGNLLMRSTDSGRTWGPSNVLQDVFCLLFDSRRPSTAYAGSWDTDFDYSYSPGIGGSVFTSRDSGRSWTRTLEDLGGTVNALAIDPFSDRVVYAGTDAGTFLRSPDAGVNWERWDTSYAGYAVLSLVTDPVEPGRLYAGTWAGVFRSTDGGREWHPFSQGLSGYAALALVLSPDGKRLYAGTDGGGIFVTEIPFDRPPPTKLPPPPGPRTIPPR